MKLIFFFIEFPISLTIRIPLVNDLRIVMPIKAFIATLGYWTHHTLIAFFGENHISITIFRENRCIILLLKKFIYAGFPIKFPAQCRYSSETQNNFQLAPQYNLYYFTFCCHLKRDMYIIIANMWPECIWMKNKTWNGRGKVPNGTPK